MNDLIINETNVGDISAEIIASLVNLHILPHDVPQETFDKWMGVVEKTLRYELQNLRQENKQLILERESLRREITELELKLSQYHSLLDKGFDIINDHLSFSYGVWLDKATKLLQEEE